MGKKQVGVFESLKSLFGQAKDELATLRGKIEETTASIEEVGSRPIDLRTAQGKLRQGIADIGKRFQEDRFRQMAFLNQESLPNSLALNFQNVDPLEFMCWLQPELVQQKMEIALRAFLENNPGIAPTERAEKLMELRNLLNTLEMQEEQLVREADSVGMKVGRRPDASPEIVLAE